MVQWNVNFLESAVHCIPISTIDTNFYQLRVELFALGKTLRQTWLHPSRSPYLFRQCVANTEIMHDHVQAASSQLAHNLFPRMEWLLLCHIKC